MAETITAETKLRRGSIVRIRVNNRVVVLGIVVRHEKFLKKPGFYAFTHDPKGDQAFEKEPGIDNYSRHHISDIVRDKGEIITRDELEAMQREMPTRSWEELLRVTASQKQKAAH